MTHTQTQHQQIPTDFATEIGILNTMHENHHPVSEAEQMLTEYIQINKPEFEYLIPQLIFHSKYHA